MTKEVNVFHLGKQSRDSKDQTFKVNLIEGLTSEHEKELEYEPEYEFDLEQDDFNLDQIADFAVEQATTSSLTPLSLEPVNLPPNEYNSSSELKALPDHLKQVYLGEKEALLVIIASHLTEKQEEDLRVEGQQRSHQMDNG